MFQALWLVTAMSLQAPSAPAPQPTVSPNRAFSTALKGVPGHLQAEVPPEVDLVEEATLPPFVSSGGKSSAPTPSRSKTPTNLAAEESQTCRRQLIFSLQPKETVTLSLDVVDRSKFVLAFGIPADASHPLAAQVQRAKRIHPMVRATGVTFTNGSEAPTELVVVISGYENYPYKLKALRSR